MRMRIGSPIYMRGRARQCFIGGGACRTMDVQDAKKRLGYGNKRYASGERIITSPSGPLRAKLATIKQKPYAAILCCSDSRAIPEAVFGATAGELYIVRNLGNVPSDEAIGSLRFAVEELHIEYILVMGHSDCDAVSRALAGDIGTGALAKVLGTVRTAVSSSPDPSLAANVNARFAAIMVRNALEGLKVTVEAGVLDLATGEVTYL
ncbi:MAG: hypothetical protein E7Z63_01255 [Thermoplasmata archaeon]|nr:hypothetical protein [Thermoplasmata archaeon]